MLTLFGSDLVLQMGRKVDVTVDKKTTLMITRPLPSKKSILQAKALVDLLDGSVVGNQGCEVFIFYCNFPGFRSLVSLVGFIRLQEPA